MTTVTRCVECNADLSVVFMAIELGSSTWKLAFAIGRGQRPRIRTIPARDLPRLAQEIAAAKARFGVPADAAVRSCYEAGRDGFWVHRALTAMGTTNVVVDPSSIAVDRRQRRVKSDRVDVIALITQLMNAAAGDRRGWRELHVPSPQAEAERHLDREWDALARDRTRLRNRIHGLLATQGIRLALTPHFVAALAAARLWDVTPLAPELVTRLERDWSQLQQLEARRTVVAALRRARVIRRDDRLAQQAARLARLRGIGLTSGLTLSAELFAWRAFTNGRQIGACVGLTPTPYRSDQRSREQGIGRSGNGRIRALSVELAWAWLRHQPGSALSRWFHERFGQHGRARRIGIIAVARKLLIALWRYLETGTVPVGAVLKTSA